MYLLPSGPDDLVGQRFGGEEEDLFCFAKSVSARPVFDRKPPNSNCTCSRAIELLRDANGVARVAVVVARNDFELFAVARRPRSLICSSARFQPFL